jgi:hypothetical protein
MPSIAQFAIALIYPVAIHLANLYLSLLIPQNLALFFKTSSLEANFKTFFAFGSIANLKRFTLKECLPRAFLELLKNPPFAVSAIAK